MVIAFVTTGDFQVNATLKRATGMAGPLILLNNEVHIIIEDSVINRHKVDFECSDAIIHWYQPNTSARIERNDKISILGKISPDVVWLCGVGFRNFCFPCRKFPVVLGDYSELFSAIEARGLTRRFLDKTLELAHLISFTGHICASRYLEMFYSKRCDLLNLRRPIHYSPYAYTSRFLNNNQNETINLRKIWGSSKVILYMGSFWKQYGFWDMLQVFNLLANERDDFHVLMMGDGPEKMKGVNWIKKNNLEDKVTFLGFVEENIVSDYLKLADAFLCPLNDSIQDWARCPSKLYMYLAFQKPIITCKIGEAYEIFGEDGFYYTPGNRNELRQTINIILNLKQCVSQINPMNHTWHHRAKCFIDWYQSNISTK